GPSWYWMPEIFEDFFKEYGYKVSDFYQLKRLDPSYRVFFSEYEFDVPSNSEKLGELLNQLESGADLKLKQFLNEAAIKYQTGMGEFVHKPSLSIREFFQFKILKALFQLNLFTPISKHIRKYFKHPEIIQLLEFPVLFLGAKPSKTPALYSLMNYADLELGTWYPQGGMTEIPKAMEKVAKEQGAVFHYNCSVQKINSAHSQVHSLETDEGILEFDAVIGAGDYHHIETKLLQAEDRSYSSKYWESRTMSPSSLLFYLAIDKEIPGLLHHNLFFDNSFEEHAAEIYDNPSWPTNPLFYACVPSKTDSSVAPKGKENIFLLIPVAPDLTSNEEMREQYLNNLIERMEKRTGVDIKKHIIFKKSFAHEEFISEYNSFKGNAYGLANTLMQTAFLKPQLRSKKLKNLYFAGQLTVPGPGVPPSIISGKLSVETLDKKYFNNI
ncbi:MAG: phytoene desaturase family protein, partial [Bacteroidota bacterium]